MMQREDESAREEFSYTHIPTLERASGGGTLSRRLDRERDRVERDSYIVDVRASDLELDQAEPLHPCFSYRAWLYSILIGVRAHGLDSIANHTTISVYPKGLIASLNLCLCVPLCGYGYDSQCSLLITAGFSLYLGNVFPDAMDYLRCAAGAVSVCYTADTEFISVCRTSVVLSLLFSITF